MKLSTVIVGLFCYPCLIISYLARLYCFQIQERKVVITAIYTICTTIIEIKSRNNMYLGEDFMV